MQLIAKVTAAGLLGLTAASAQAACIGNCGTASPNGVVTAPPAFGPDYQFVSTYQGVVGAGQIASVGGGDPTANGSEFTTASFSASQGDNLNFYFNYVTSDGSGNFTDYTFVELLESGNHAAWLFTARTTPSGNTSPGFGLPPNDSTLTPASTPIIDGAPAWAQLGPSSGTCFDVGCGYTGWIQSQYTIGASGNYQLRFAATNFGDDLFDSGLAFAGVTINDVPVGVPEPGAWAMMILGLGSIGAMARRRRTLSLVTPDLA